MPFVYLNEQGQPDFSRGAFSTMQPDMNMLWVKQADWEDHLASLTIKIETLSPTQKLFQSVQLKTFPWSKLYQAAKQSASAQLALSFLFTGLSNNLSSEFVIDRFRDLIGTLHDQNLLTLSSEDVVTIESAVIEAGLDPSAIWPEDFDVNNAESN